MAGKIEINRIALQVNRELLKTWEGDLLFVSGQLPVLDIPFKAGLTGLQWASSDGRNLTVQVFLVGEFNDPKWFIISRLEGEMTIRVPPDMISWEDFDSLIVTDLQLAPESVFFLDDHKVDLIDTINKILAHQKTKLPGKIKEFVDSRLNQLSRQLFNSELLFHLLQPLYFRIHSQMDFPLEHLEFTTSAMQENFSVAENSPPYLFLQIPTRDLVYFFNHSIQPKLDIKGYELIFESIEVIRDNNLAINLIESTNDWKISFDAVLELQDNSIHLKVGEIQVQGLDILKKVLFGLFKNVLIGQIEKRPVSIVPLFDNLKKRIEGKYPFVRLMPGQDIQMDSILIDPESTEVMIHFDAAPSPEVS